ncbi:MAG: histidine phosphatase family protein [Alphaproteobacteria bacterium]
MKNFYIFRHGQSSYNLAGRTQGQTNDSVLTELGKEQASEVGKRLKSLNIDIILSSPLKRALQTTEFANKTLNTKVVVDDRFTEVNVGEIEGLHYTEIQEKYGEKYLQWRSLDKQFENIHFKGGETKKQVRERIFNGLNEWAKNSEHSNIAVSSHGIALSQILIALGKEAEDVKNGAILHLKKDNNDWSIVEWI